MPSKTKKITASIAIAERLSSPERDDGLVIALFLERSRLRSPATARVYRQAITRFLAWHGGPLESVQYGDLVGFQSAPRGAGGLGGFAPATQARHLATLRSLFGLAVEIGYLTRNPTKLLVSPRSTTKQQPWLNAEELAMMLRAGSDMAEQAGGGWALIHAMRDRAISALACTTGCRSAELSCLSWSDFYRDPKGRIGATIHGKGSRIREVKILPVVWDIIADYRRAMGRPVTLKDSDPRPLFVNRHGGRLSPLGIARAVALIAKRGGMERRVTPHAIRRGVATASLAGGASLRQVQAQLGHASIGTTQRYLMLAEGLEETAADYLAAIVAASRLG